MPIERRPPTGSRPSPGDGETSRSERVAGWFRVPLLVAALLAVPVIVVQESDPGRSWASLAAVLDWVIWGVFAVHLGAMLAVVPDRRRWLRDNPLDVLIVVLTPPFLPAAMKVARVLPLVRVVWLLALAGRVRGLFSLEGLRYAALVSFMIVVVGGTVFVAVEPEQHLSTWDGLWWAAETITTVAYGDIYPQTAAGRVVATVVMTTGIGFVAVLTGALAQRFLQDRGDDATPKRTSTETEMIRRMDEMSRQIAELRKTLQDRHE